MTTTRCGKSPAATLRELGYTVREAGQRCAALELLERSANVDPILPCQA